MENTKMEKQVEQFLKQIIKQKGISYLNKNPYAVYEELIKTDSVNQCSARLILMTFLAGAAKNEINDEAALSRYI